jgi:predicted Rossmann fold flavoprotein
MKKKRLVVIGGGAAGFFCAVNAARMDPALEVMVLEKTGKLLSKVRVSGGGRCNVTHASFSIAEMVKGYPRGGEFLKKAFHHFFTKDTISWFSERGVELKTEPDGRMFPVTDSSQTIVDCLMKEANRYGVGIMMNADLRSLKVSGELLKEGGKKFEILLGNKRVIRSDLVCIACGGYPKSGGYDWLKDLGHTVEEPVPSLFTFNMPGKEIKS